MPRDEARTVRLVLDDRVARELLGVDDAAIFLTTKEGAEALSISPRKLYALMDARIVPYTKIGRSRRIARRDLERLADRLAALPAGDPGRRLQ